MKVTFKYLVIAGFVLFMMVSCVFSGVTLRNLNIDIFMNEDGSAVVREEYILDVTTNASMEKYNRNLQYLQKNDLQTWISNLGFNELKYHIGGKQAPISDLIITPSQLYGINYYAEEGLAKIILDYKVAAPSKVYNETRGLFIITHPKPRVTRYALNHNGLNFDMTEDGDVMLPENTAITFHLDTGMYLLYAQPFPENINITRFSDITVRDLTWSMRILPKFSLIIEHEKSLETEILDYIDKTNVLVYEVFSGPEGLAVAIIIVAIIVSIMYWHHLRGKQQ